MADTPNTYKLKGRLQIVIDDMEGVIELGEIEVPIAIDFRKQGPTYRGPGISSETTRGRT